MVEIDSEDKAKALDSVSIDDKVRHVYGFIGLVCPTKTQECQTNFNLWVWETSNIPLVNTTGWQTHFYKNGGRIDGHRHNYGNCYGAWWRSPAPGIWTPRTCSTTSRYGQICEKGTEFLITNIQTM